jgi:hypothetical protein
VAKATREHPATRRKECAVSPDQLELKERTDRREPTDRMDPAALQERSVLKSRAVEQAGGGAALPGPERPLDVWSRCAPIRLAGYEDDPTETHILRGID